MTFTGHGEARRGYRSGSPDLDLCAVIFLSGGLKQVSAQATLSCQHLINRSFFFMEVMHVSKYLYIFLYNRRKNDTKTSLRGHYF